MYYSTGVTIAASGAVLAAVPGKRINVLGFAIVSTLANSVKLQSASTDISGTFPLAANGGLVLGHNTPGGAPWATTAVGEALNINMTVSTSCGIQLIYSLT